MAEQKIKNTTLVPVDFSKCSKSALKHACDIATVIEEKQNVHLLYVIEDREINELINSKTEIRDDGSHESILVEGARSKLKELISEFKEDYDLPMDYSITGGKPYEKIAEVADKIDAESIVMGTMGAKGAFASFIGSNAAKVMQISPCPVIAINEQARAKEYNKIVLPLDLEKETRQKVKYAIQMAKYFNSTVHVVSAMENDRYLQQRVKNNLYEVERRLKESNVDYTTDVLTDVDDFVDSTIKFAEEKDADLIIIMTRQEQSIRDFFLGSYAQRIVHKSLIPVMAIHPNQEFMKSYSMTSPGMGI